MTNKEEKTVRYFGIGTAEPLHSAVPILTSGIGTRIGKAADVIGTRKLVAELIGASPAALQRYIAEENMPPFDVAARLCAAAGVRMEWLAFDQGPMRHADTESLPKPQTTARNHSQPVRSDAAVIDSGLLAKAKRISDEVLTEEGIRHQFGPEEFANFVQIVYDDLAHGYAAETAAKTLESLLSVAGTKPGQLKQEG